MSCRFRLRGDGGVGRNVTTLAEVFGECRREEAVDIDDRLGVGVSLDGMPGESDRNGEHAFDGLSGSFGDGRVYGDFVLHVP